jgi:pyruvate formate lyase activating enzyme
MTGIVFDIQRFSLHDGPGIRTTVFLKGCPARCAWCHNPESFSLQPELQYYKDRCTGCGKCVQLCPNKAHVFNKEADPAGGHVFKRDLCNACGLCTNECFSNALVISGRKESTDEVLRQVMDDLPYYEESGGGVTLSGGEPVLQADFCEALLKRFKENNIHTNIQTAGFYPFEMLDRLLPYLDLVMYDIKGLSPNIFSNYIHADSTLALDNLASLDKKARPFIVRIPCIKGVNDSVEEIKTIAQFLSKFKYLEYLSFLPYHNLARIKYDVLDLEFKSFEAPAKDHLEMLNGIAAQYVKVA